MLPVFIQHSFGPWPWQERERCSSPCTESATHRKTDKGMRKPADQVRQGEKPALDEGAGSRWAIGIRRRGLRETWVPAEPTGEVERRKCSCLNTGMEVGTVCLERPPEEEGSPGLQPILL